jgi:Development and cell death domain
MISTWPLRPRDMNQNSICISRRPSCRPPERPRLKEKLVRALMKTRTFDRTRGTLIYHHESGWLSRMISSPAGFIFGCTDATESDCYAKKLFGMPRVWLPEVQKIVPRTPLFLYNFNSGSLFGLFKAASQGAENIDPSAWEGKYPAQVRFEPFRTYPSLRREAFEAIIRFPKGRPYPILTGSQVEQLIGLFEGRTTRPTQEIVAYKTSDGHVVRSRGEAIVDESLFRHHIVHAYERTVFLDEIELHPDFYLPGSEVYIEYWGGKTEEYMARKQTKIDSYARHEIKLVSLEDADLKDIDKSLARSLSRYGYKFY